MPSPRKTSRSPGRKRVRGRSRTRSGSRSRSRSRSRGRSQSGTRQQPSLSPPTRASRSTKRESVKREKGQSTSPHRDRDETPTRKSARIAAQSDIKLNEEDVNSKLPELMKLEDRKVRKKTGREFGGPLGTFCLTLLLPLTVYALTFACSKNGCSIRKFPGIPRDLKAYFDVKATLIFLGWMAFQSVIYCLPIGRVVNGQPLRNGKKLQYRCNGFHALVLSLMAFGVAVYMKLPVTMVYDKFLPLITTATIFSFALSIFLYIKSLSAKRNHLAPHGDTDNFFYDFFMGHELNPRVRGFDLKFFCEMRPGLIGWIMLDLCFIAKSCQHNPHPSAPLCLVSLFHALYVADALWFEDAILTTMDIVHDGFGFMLAFGDLVWVPFLYSLQTRFLLESVQSWKWYGLAATSLLNLIGYIMFRGSNSQKNAFRKDPHNPALAHLESLPTPTGRRLLVSGWWGLCRHPNYMGDLIMALAWSIPTGFSHILPYFYPIYFLILLVHRGRRDDANCQKKYGTSWDRYCDRVKYKIIPHIY